MSIILSSPREVKKLVQYSRRSIWRRNSIFKRFPGKSSTGWEGGQASFILSFSFLCLVVTCWVHGFTNKYSQSGQSGSLAMYLFWYLVLDTIESIHSEFVEPDPPAAIGLEFSKDKKGIWAKTRIHRHPLTSALKRKKQLRLTSLFTLLRAVGWVGSYPSYSSCQYCLS